MKHPPFKQTLVDFLQNQLLQQLVTPITWKCKYCNKQHNGDLLKRTHSVRASAEDVQVIQLVDKEGNIFGVIDISKNKKPNIDKSKSFHESGIIYIQLALPVNGENPLESLSNPRFVDTCLNPKCKKCGEFQREKSIVIIDSFCWKCENPMKVAVMAGDGYQYGPDEFSDEELAFARSKGAIIKNNYSKTVGHSYLSNTCRQCDILTGNHFLFSEHYIEAMYGNYTYEQFLQGYSCEHCDSI